MPKVESIRLQGAQYWREQVAQRVQPVWHAVIHYHDLSPGFDDAQSLSQGLSADVLRLFVQQEENECLVVPGDFKPQCSGVALIERERCGRSKFLSQVT